MCWNVACGLIWLRSAKVFVFVAVLYHLPQPSLAGLGFGVSFGGVLSFIWLGFGCLGGFNVILCFLVCKS